jgi:predicted nucleic acid-binding protein
MIVLDANVLIAFLDESDSHFATSLELLQRHSADQFATSALTAAEILVHPTRANRQDAASTALARIGVTVIALEPDDAAELARVRNTYRLRMPDAVVLQLALKVGAQLATFDHSLSAAAHMAGVSVVT